MPCRQLGAARDPFVALVPSYQPCCICLECGLVCGRGAHACGVWQGGECMRLRRRREGRARMRAPLCGQSQGSSACFVNVRGSSMGGSSLSRSPTLRFSRSDSMYSSKTSAYRPKRSPPREVMPHWYVMTIFVPSSVPETRLVPNITLYMHGTMGMLHIPWS